MINRLVMRFGGRQGWLGYFYSETTHESAERRLGDLARERMRVEMQQEDNQATMRRLERKTKRLWAENRRVEAIDAVRELREARASFTRAGQRRSQIDSVRSMMQELVAGETVEDHIGFYALAMGERMQTANPQRMARILQRCSTLDEMRRMTADQLRDHFQDQEQEELDRVAEELDDDTLNENVLVELGLVERVEDAAAPPTTLPGDNGGATGGGGGRGGGGVKTASPAPQ